MTKYLDYVNIMTYDLHGAWNEFVGITRTVMTTGKDGELFNGRLFHIPVWWYRLFKIQTGPITISGPNASRSHQHWCPILYKRLAERRWRNNGMNGKAALPDQSDCPEVYWWQVRKTIMTVPGTDNMWHR